MKTNNVKLKWIYAVSTTCISMYLLTACGVNQAFQVTSMDVDRLQSRGYGYTATAKELEDGYKLYVIKCGNCHNLVAPAKYTSSEWQLKYLPQELEKAKVVDEKEKKLITMFILSKAR
jgi:cytochrome c5